MRKGLLIIGGILFTEGLFFLIMGSAIWDAFFRTLSGATAVLGATLILGGFLPEKKHENKKRDSDSGKSRGVQDSRRSPE
jgi:predicted phage tail protein